jgi:hypothetical protein
MVLRGVVLLGFKRALDTPVEISQNVTSPFTTTCDL